MLDQHPAPATGGTNRLPDAIPAVAIETICITPTAPQSVGGEPHAERTPEGTPISDGDDAAFDLDSDVWRGGDFSWEDEDTPGSGLGLTADATGDAVGSGVRTPETAGFVVRYNRADVRISEQEAPELLQLGLFYRDKRDELADKEAALGHQGLIETLTALADAHRTTPDDFLRQLQEQQLTAQWSSEGYDAETAAELARKQAGDEAQTRLTQRQQSTEAGRAATRRRAQAEEEFRSFEREFPAEARRWDDLFPSLTPYLRGGRPLRDAYLQYRNDTLSAQNSALAEKLAATFAAQKAAEFSTGSRAGVGQTAPDDWQTAGW